MMRLHNIIHKSDIILIIPTRIRRRNLPPIVKILCTPLPILSRNVTIRRLQSCRWMKGLSHVTMVIIQIRWPKLIRWPTLCSSSPHIVLRLLLWFNHWVRHTNNLIRLTTLLRRMVSPTTTTIITLSFGLTLILCMLSSTKQIEFFPLHILTFRRKSLIVTLSIFRLLLTLLVLWRWTIISSLITVLSTSTKLTSVAGWPH